MRILKVGARRGSDVNNCNGVADEATCQVCQSTEICGNGKDDNCDCVIDNCGTPDPDPVIK